MLEQFALAHRIECQSNLRLTEPLGYLDMLTLNRHARLILTDSGGLQEEATVLGVPCITLRDNTERPITVEAGGNQLVGNHPKAIYSAVQDVLDGSQRSVRVPELWDGQAAIRIVDILKHFTSTVPSDHHTQSLCSQCF